MAEEQIKILGGGCIFSGLCINQSNEKFYEEVLMPATRLLPTEFSHKTGVWASGFDKHAEAVEGLSQLGFDFIEIGSAIPEPQPGQPKPRVFRLVADEAIIYCYGFNSEGAILGKNKDSTSAKQDYVEGVQIFGPIADYLNISSPNTPGFRDLQGKNDLQELKP
uniref:Dihydroorotate dehydrogenase catalytic domain-containing protein n=1 Tax=Glossina austeni TaxID=7395 RepID=A0A1A9UD56_GLOAU